MSQTLSAFGVCTAATLTLLGTAHGGVPDGTMIGQPVRVTLGHTCTRSGTQALEALFGIQHDRNDSIGFRCDPTTFERAFADGFSDDAEQLASSFDDNTRELTDAGDEEVASWETFRSLAAAHRVLHDAGFTFFLD